MAPALKYNPAIVNKDPIHDPIDINSIYIYPYTPIGSNK